MNKVYPTDLIVKPVVIYKKLLSGDRMRKRELKEMWNTIFYLVKKAVNGEYFLKEYSKWKLMYYYFRRWSFCHEFDLLSNKLRKTI